MSRSLSGTMPLLTRRFYVIRLLLGEDFQAKAWRRAKKLPRE
jgi:hypothetical protein